MARPGNSKGSVEVIDLPDFDMSDANGNQLVSHPSHPVDATDAFVASMKRGSAGTGVDVPDVEEAIVG